MTAMLHEDYMTAEEVAGLIRMTPDFIWRQTRLGKLPAVKVGRYYRYRRTTVERWLQELEGPAPDAGPEHS